MAGIIQQSGFNYSAVDKTIRFTDKKGNYFWSNGSSWGMCEISDDKVNFYVKYGNIELKNLFIGKELLEDVEAGEHLSKKLI